MDNVTYEVTGDAESVDVTLSNDNGGQEQYNDVPLPFRMDYVMVLPPFWRNPLYNPTAANPSQASSPNQVRIFRQEWVIV